MVELNCDVLIVGGGAAGSRAALEAKRCQPDLRVLLAVSGEYGKTGSTQLIASESLGINAPFNFAGDGDSADVYYQDMLSTGGGLSDPRLCRIIADESCTRIRDLTDLGLVLDSNGGVPIQTKLSGCTKARSLTCGGSTGREMLNALQKGIAEVGVDILEDTRILDLCQDDNRRVIGAVGLRHGEPVVIHAAATVLATGGAGCLFRKNVNPPTLEGDAWAIAYRAGARLVNLEFFQIGPVVVKPKIKFIIHGHMWKLNPKLTNGKGEEFLANYCPDGVTAAEVIDAKTMSYPFSVRTVAKYLDIAIFKEIMSGRGTANEGVFFDVTHVGEQELRCRAPITYDTLRKAGTDLSKERIELGLAVQNFNGGIMIDEDGFTGVEGLYAAGEVTGGVHGADRPGGNNLIDTQVFGCRAGRAASDFAQSAAGRKSRTPLTCGDSTGLQARTSEDNEIARKRAALYEKELTVVRTANGLRKVLEFIAEQTPKSTSCAERNGLLVGQTIALAALIREESRGTHYREDFPVTVPKFMRRAIIHQGSRGEPTVTFEKLSNCTGWETYS
jgi:succinate dehydrogenase/fumarate reductase flavoprotein subunit